MFNILAKQKQHGSRGFPDLGYWRSHEIETMREDLKKVFLIKKAVNKDAEKWLKNNLRK
jgi:hypothetical protein